MAVTEPRPPVSRALPVPLLLVCVMWAVEIVDVVLPQQLDVYGIRPLDREGLVGIAAAPFLHAGFAHLIANTGAFIVLGVLVAALSRRPWTVTVGVALISGIGVWLVGVPGTVHVGASGLVYGYAAFLVAWGVLTRRVVSILVAVAVVLLYGGLVWGVLPTQSGVSWQGHLFGAVGGVVVAYWLSRRQEPARLR